MSVPKGKERGVIVSQVIIVIAYVLRELEIVIRYLKAFCQSQIYPCDIEALALIHIIGIVVIIIAHRIIETERELYRSLRPTLTFKASFWASPIGRGR